MSYFSHNPEAWDEIQRKGIARALSSYHRDSEGGYGQQEEIEETLDEIIVNYLGTNTAVVWWKK